MKLEGRVAIVTGGARGNGFAAAKAMAQEGANIVIADICEDIPTMPYPMSTVESMMAAVEDGAFGLDVRSAAGRTLETLDVFLRLTEPDDIPIINLAIVWSLPVPAKRTGRN